MRLEDLIVDVLVYEYPRTCEQDASVARLRRLAHDGSRFVARRDGEWAEAADRLESLDKMLVGSSHDGIFSLEAVRHKHSNPRGTPDLRLSMIVPPFDPAQAAVNTAEDWIAVAERCAADPDYDITRSSPLFAAMVLMVDMVERARNREGAVQ